MKLSLKNIGVIEDATIQLDGLTIVAGVNSSGKSTVGKILYCLGNAFQDVQKSTQHDKICYLKPFAADIVRVFNGVLECCKDNDAVLLRHMLPQHTKDWKLYVDDSVLFLHEAQQDMNVALADESRFFERISENIQRLHVFMTQCPRVRDEMLARHVCHSLDLLLRRVQEVRNNFLQLSPTFQDTPNCARIHLNTLFQKEFEGRVQRSTTQRVFSRMCFQTAEQTFHIALKNNAPLPPWDVVPAFPYSRCFLIDNPFLLDDLNATIASQHQSKNPRIMLHESRYVHLGLCHHHDHLRLALAKPPIRAPFVDIDSKIHTCLNSLVPGHFAVNAMNHLIYQCEGRNEPLMNLAAGTKMAAMIKILLQKSLLDKSSILIIDGPEAYLHPARQKSFAEVIVLLVKQLRVNVLLISHSHNFLLAVDAFVHKYEMHRSTHFYKTRFVKGGGAVCDDCTDNMSVLYQDFTRNFAEVKMRRDSYRGKMF